MKIIALLNQKGGCGKTTIAVNLAHSFQKQGYQVLLVDSDPQGSARDWNEINEGQIIPVVGLDRESLAKDIEAVKYCYDFIIIDGAPSIAKLSVAAVKIADLVVIPVQPSPWDIWATADLVEIIKVSHEIRNDKPLAVFLISRAIKQTKLTKEVTRALLQYNLPVLSSFTTQRIMYPTTASEGQTVYYKGSNAATIEIGNIRDEIIGVLNGIKN